jgi:stage II sporulation protein D
MKSNWQQILCVLVLGMMMPVFIFRFGSLFRTQPITTPTEATQSLHSQPTEKPSMPDQIPVLVDGEASLMDIDAYLIGVVLAEMPASFEPEALKAQAVVARTFAWKRCEDADHHSQGAVCTDSNCCQAYVSIQDYLNTLGDQEDVDIITQAVLDTTGQVLTYQGKLAEATYFSCSGGRTEDAAAVWGSEIPYLQAVDSPGEEWATMFIHRVSFTPAEFSAALETELSGDPKNWIGEVTRSAGGGVATMEIGSDWYTGVQLRKLLDLNSTSFTILFKNGNFVITTKGKGHRVGMSQYGADAMAVLGSRYQEILAHYYPSTVIDKMDALE